MEVEAPAERAYGDHADRNQPDDNNETMVVQEHADAAEDLYRDISIPKAEDETNGNPANPAISNGKRSTCACCCFPSKATPGSSRDRDGERRQSQPREDARAPQSSERERSNRTSKERSRHRHRDEHEEKDKERPRDKERSGGRDRDRDRDAPREHGRDRDRDRERHSDRRSHREGDDREPRSDHRHRDGGRGRDGGRDGGRDAGRGRDDRSDHRSRDEYRSHGASDKDKDRSHGRDRDRDREHGRDSRYGERDHERGEGRYGDKHSDRYAEHSQHRDRDQDRDRRRHEDKEGMHGRRDYRHNEERDDFHGGKGGKPDLVLGGYKPRQRSSGAIVPQAMDPFAAVRAKNRAQGLHVNNPLEVEKAKNEQQAKARQMVLQQQAISTAAAASKTQREVYIGNLQQGKVTEQTLRQLFDEALSTTFPHLLTPGVKPCLSVAMHSEGRYAFVELATPEMATAALQLSGQLNFLGSQMTVGRPSGYIDPQKAAAAAAAASKALQEFTSDGDVGQVLAVGEAPPLASQPTQCLCIDHMVGVSVFTDEEEYQELVEDLHEECGKHGTVVDTRIPCPDRATMDVETIIGTGCYGKVYALMDSTDNAVNIQNTFNGRVYDGRTLQVSFIQPAHFYMLPVPIPMLPEPPFA